jgi:uncharacterized protein YuzE
MTSEPCVYVHYDPEVDALYVDLRTRFDGDVERSVELDTSRVVDYDAAGEVLGVEFLWASDGLDLTGVPQPDTIRAALKAFTALSAA